MRDKKQRQRDEAARILNAGIPAEKPLIRGVRLEQVESSMIRIRAQSGSIYELYGVSPRSEAFVAPTAIDGGFSAEEQARYHRDCIQQIPYSERTISQDSALARPNEMLQDNTLVRVCSSWWSARRFRG